MDAGIGAAIGDRPGDVRVNKNDAVSKFRAVAPFAGLALVILAFSILSGSPAQYLSIVNVRIVLAQTVIVAIGAIGMTMIIVSGGIDLSVGSSIALTSVVTALALLHAWPPIVAIAAGVAAGGIV